MQEWYVFKNKLYMKTEDDIKYIYIYDISMNVLTQQSLAIFEDKKKYADLRHFRELQLSFLANFSNLTFVCAKLCDLFNLALDSNSSPLEWLWRNTCNRGYQT